MAGSGDEADAVKPRGRARSRAKARPVPKSAKHPQRTRLDRAKLFMNGRSQAVRLPREFRFRGKEVSIRREGEAVILEPLDGRRWPRGYWERLAELSQDFPADFDLAQDPVPPPIEPAR